MTAKGLKTFGLILLWICSLPVRGVDLTALEVDVKLHPEEYRSLLDRFLSADTTLTDEEMRTVYYGYSCMVDYDPGQNYSNVHRALDGGENEEARRLALEALAMNPVSLDLNVALLTAADRLKEDGQQGALLLEYGIKSDQIATAILSSGRGTSAQSPFVVIYTSDITPVLRNVIGVDEILERTTVGDGSVNAIKVTLPGNDRTHILYFDDTREARFRESHNRTGQ